MTSLSCHLHSDRYVDTSLSGYLFTSHHLTLPTIPKIRMTTPSDLESPSLFQVKGYVAVVSGGSRGLGLMAAQTLAANGARVYIIGKREEILDTVAEKFSSNGQIIPYPSLPPFPAG